MQRRLLALVAAVCLAISVHAQVTAPTLSNASRSEGTNLTPGIAFMFQWSYVRGTNAVIQIDVGYKDPNGVLRHAVQLFPAANNYVWTTVQQDWPNGTYTIEYFRLEDSDGTFTSYNRDGTITVTNGIASSPATHSLNLSLLDFRVAGATGSITVATITNISRTTPSPVDAGTLVAFDYTYTPGDDASTYISVSFTGPDAGTYTAGTSFSNPLPTSGTITMTLPSFRPNGPYQADTVSIRDNSGRTVTYRRDGTTSIDGPGSVPATHSLTINALDFVVSGGVAIDPPARLTGLSRTTAQTANPGQTITFSASFVDVTGNAITMDIAFADQSSTVRHASVSVAADAHLGSPAIAHVTVDSDWPEGAYAIQYVAFEDANHRVIRYSRDGVVSVTNGAYSGPSTHSVTLVSADFHVSFSPVVEPPSITTQPASHSVPIGATAAFTVAAAGTNPAYQWLKDGTAVAGATNGTYTIDAAQPADAASYTCRVSNSAAEVISNGATLTVTGPTSWLSNMSIRTTMTTGQNPVIIGLTIGGGSKPILVRGAGPALAIFNLPGVLPDPRLEVYRLGDTTMSWSNDDWDATSGLSDIFDALGAFGFVTGSKDAGVVKSLDGSYTAQVPGTGNGIVLIEAYDTHPGVNSPRLTNISARNKVGAGNDVLIAGFAVTGTGSKRLLIRGIGPTLANYSVSGILHDPLIQVYNAQRAVIAENNDWNSTLTTDFDAVKAFPLNAGSKDAALVTTLGPGTYSVLLKGADGGTGEGMVEVYELP